MKLRRATGEFSLAEALWEFATPKLRNELRKVAKAPSPVTDAYPNKSKSEIWLDVITSFQGIMGALSRQVDAQKHMEDHLAELLLQGQLVASGVQITPTLWKRPQKIPAHIFDTPKMNIVAGTVENFGSLYKAVRVRTLRLEQTISKESVAKKTDKIRSEKTRGRPSKASEIERVIDSLLHDGIDIQAKGRKSAYELVRNKAKSLQFNIDIGFSDPVIQRALHRRFGERS